MLANPGHPPGYPGASPDTTQAAFESRLKSPAIRAAPAASTPHLPPYPESCWGGKGTTGYPLGCCDAHRR